MKKTFHFLRTYFEAIVWLVALILLATMDPYTAGPSLCMFRKLGIESCPGCGLGHSVSAAFHGQFGQSFDMHPLGMITIVFLTVRIISIIIQNHNYQRLKNRL
ncbi:MAG: DUF2752 domain-containing protein [Bacteroidales bacterium]|nr:DUF2752 domain-containing protein [Bacteroidales bacterium]